MKRLFVLIIFSLFLINAKTQTLVADSLNCILYNDTSRKVCVNADTVKLDLNNDSIYDVMLWKELYQDTCWWQWWNYSLTGAIEIKTNSSAFKLPVHIGIFGYALNGYQLGNIIDTSLLSIQADFYVAFFSGVHCQYVTGGWPSNSAYYFCVREVYNQDTIYHLVKFRISSSYQCFQVITERFNNIEEHITDNYSVVFENNILRINQKNMNTYTYLTIYDLQGNIIKKEQFRTSDYVLDMYHLTNGMYLINLMNDHETLTRKIVKY